MRKNVGIEYLRVFSMTLVTCIHFLCYNNLWGGHDLPIYNKIFTSILISLSCSCRNIFIMLTGYLLCKKNFKIHRIVNSWSYLWIVCFTTGLFVCLFSPKEFNIVGALRTAFPILTGSYWYMISYFILLLFAPIINIFFENKQNKSIIELLLLFAGIIIFCIMDFNPLISTEKFLGPDSSVLYFCYMYAIGAYIKSYGIKCNFLLALSGLISFVVLFCSAFFDIRYPVGISLVSMSSLISVILSVSIFCLCVNLSPTTINERRFNLLELLGRSSLCVYIIQENYFFRNWFWSVVEPFQYKDSPMLIVVWMLCVVLFWILACLMYKWYGILQRMFLKKFEDKISDILLHFVEKCKLKIA